MRGAPILAYFLLIAAIPAILADSDDHAGPLNVETTAPSVAKSTGPRSDIRVDVNMTLVPVTVLDSYGRNVRGLQKANFRVQDGSKEVPIAAFSRQDAPISVGLIFDCSDSMKPKFAKARLAPAELYNRLNTMDESFLVTLADEAKLRQNFTPNFDEIQNDLIFTQPRGVTALLDAIYLGLSELRHAHNPRKALVVVTDGGDNNSRYSLNEIRNLAEESDAQIFGIGLYDNPQTPEERNGPGLISDLCKRTGGVNFVVRSPEDLSDAMAKIGTALHNEYVLGFYPPSEAQPGKFRKIKVQLQMPAGFPHLEIYARRGYYAPVR